MPTKIYIKTYGCALNQSDSELMAGLLEKADFEIVKDIAEAYAVIINTCTVKGPTEAKFFKFLKDVEEKYPYKKIIITGCIAQTAPRKLKKYALLGTSRISEIVQLVEEAINDNPIQMTKWEKLPRLNLPHKRKNPVIEIIPICEGCLGDPCAYCKVKFARGDLISYPKEEIINQVRKAVLDRVPEIWLTAQDTGCYGKDIGSSLPELLEDILRISGSFKIRLGMCNPNHVFEYLDKLIEIFKSDKMFKFLHAPAQSGNNKILKSMKRKYTAEQYKEIVKKFRADIPSMTFATDIICGFPNETEEQFYDSIDIIRKTNPDKLAVSRFWAMSGTEAAKMEGRLHGNETKRRSTVLADIAKNISLMNNEKWLGWEGEVLIDEHGKDNTFVGRNMSYKPILLKGDYKLGDKVKIKVTKIGPFDLRTF